MNRLSLTALCVGNAVLTEMTYFSILKIQYRKSVGTSAYGYCQKILRHIYRRRFTVSDCKAKTARKFKTLPFAQR